MSGSSSRFVSARETSPINLSSRRFARQTRALAILITPPGPNIALSIQRVVGNEHRDVPFRLNSSGLGRDLDVYWVDADIDILEEKAVRQQKAEQFVAWIVSQSGGERQSQLLQRSPGRPISNSRDENFCQRRSALLP